LRPSPRSMGGRSGASSPASLAGMSPVDSPASAYGLESPVQSAGPMLLTTSVMSRYVHILLCKTCVSFGENIDYRFLIIRVLSFVCISLS
jgi:hypothetical protein